MDDHQERVARIARETMLELMSRGIPPVPDNYRRVFVELCEKRGVTPPAASGAVAEPAPPRAVTPVPEAELLPLLLGLAETVGLAVPGHSGAEAVVGQVQRLASPGAESERPAVPALLQRVDRLNLELRSAPLGGAASPPPAAAPAAVGGGDVVHRMVELLRALVPLADPEGAERETAIPALNALAAAGAAADASAHLESLAVFAVARRKAISAEMLSSKQIQRRIAELMNLADAVLDFLGKILPGMPEAEGLLTEARERLPRADARGLQELRLELLSHLHRFQGLTVPVNEQKTLIKGVLRTLAEQLAHASSGSAQFEQAAERIRARVEAANDLTELRTLQDLLVQEAATAASEASRMRNQLGELSSQVNSSQQQIDSLERALVETKQAMNIDPLTRVPNRRALNDWVEATLYPTGLPERGYSLLVLDLDHFKRVNDTFGHLAGDAVLAETAKRVKLGIRELDLLARYGGEEFVLVLPDCDLHIARAVAERMCTLVSRRPVVHAASTIAVTTSVGVATKRPGENFKEVFERADQCVYLAKQAGRNRAVTELLIPAGAPAAPVGGG